MSAPLPTFPQGSPARLVPTMPFQASWLGRSVPLHATSTGKVLLAALPKAEFNAWLKDKHLARLTAHTLAEPRALRAVIEDVRKVDYCLSSEEHELGVHALAVPLRDNQGRTVAALNVVAETARMNATTMKNDLLPLLWETAAAVRTLL